MDKIEKELKKLTAKERQAVKEVLERLNLNQGEGLDVKKLRGREDIFRVRKGKIRIIYRISQKEIVLLALDRRSERTYKF